MIHGSGPNDRDETIGSLKPFRDIAEGLAEHGVAVYRFDKRTYVYGNEMMADHGITPADESIEDAVNAVQLLAQQDKIDADRIFVLGHSLGGNVIPAIAQELEQAPVQAHGFVMMAASPRGLDVLMREQLEFLYSLLPEVTEEPTAEPAPAEMTVALPLSRDVRKMPKVCAAKAPKGWRMKKKGTLKGRAGLAGI